MYDFVENPWSTKKVAKALKMKEDDIYESLSNLAEYMRNNIQGFFNILEIAKQNKIKRIIYASSSSVYGDSNVFPLTEKQILKEILPS